MRFEQFGLLAHQPCQVSEPDTLCREVVIERLVDGVSVEVHDRPDEFGPVPHQCLERRRLLGGWLQGEGVGPEGSQLDPLPLLLVQWLVSQTVVGGERLAAALTDPFGLVARGDKRFERGFVEGRRSGCGGRG